MLPHTLKRAFSFLVAMLMLISPMPVSVLAAYEETYDHSYEDVEQTATDIQKTNASVINNPEIERFQGMIDAILDTYLPENVVSAEAVSGAVDAMSDEDCVAAYYAIMDLDYEIFCAQVDELVTDAELEILLNHNPIMAAFADAVYLKAETSMPVWGYYATTVTILNGQVTLVDSAGNGTGDATKYTATAKGSLFGKGTNTITITNNSGSNAKLSFDYSTSEADSFTIAAANVAGSGSYNIILESGSSVALVLTSNSGLFNTTATLNLTNIALTAAAESSNVTVAYNATYGSVTAGGDAVGSGAVVEGVTLADGVVLAATATNGGQFIGWADDSGKILSTDASYTLKPSEDTTVKAIFGGATAPCFFVGTAVQQSVSSSLLGMGKLYYYQVGRSYLYDNLNDALAKAAADSQNKVVVLANSGKLSSGTYTIPSGVTLLIPFDEGYSLYTDTVINTKDEAWVKPTEYRTLTLADGAKLVVNGALSLSVKQMTAQGSKRNGGSPTGPCSFICMEGNSNITVNNGGKLYAYGFITGSGSVTANSGATVHEMFQFMDFRGGTQTTDSDMKANKVFPLSQYYVQNIEVPLTIYSGATEKANTTIYMSSADFHQCFDFIGGSGSGMFRMSSGSYAVKKYDGATDRLIIDLYGSASLSSISMKVGTSDAIDSADYILSLNSNITVNIHSGTTTVEQDISLLPGSIVTVSSGAFIEVADGYKVIAYDSDDWNGGGYCAPQAGDFYPINYAPGKTYTRTAADLVDAKVVIDGTVNGTAGKVYTTAGGAEVISNGGGKMITVSGTEEVTHEYNQADKAYADILITPAQLQNADGSYVKTADGDGTYTYYASTGRWDRPSHYYENTVIAPTCTVAGYTKHTCAVCGATYNDTEVAALGHNEVTDAAVAATCTTAGKTEGSHCSVCGEVIVAQEEIPALGHTAGDAVEENRVEATFDKAGSYDSVVYCSVCGEEMSRTSVEIPKLVAVARIGSTRYASLAAAYTALLEGDTIVILDASAANEDVIFAKCCTVDASALDNFTVNVATGYTAEDKTGGIWYVNTSLFDIYASNLKAGDSLDLYFYIQTSDLTIAELADYSAQIVRYRNGTASEKVSIPGSQWTAYGSDYYRFCYGDIAAKEMTDKLFITICKGTTKVSDTRMESVENYALRVLKSVAGAEDGSENAALRTTLVDMLYYGAACQDYFDDYNIDDPANAEIEAFQKYVTGDDVVYENQQNGDSNYLVGTTVSAKSSLVYTFYFKDLDTSMSAEVSYKNHHGTDVTLPVIPGTDFSTRKSGYLGVDVTGLAAADGRQLITCVIKNSDGEVVTTAYGSVQSYVYVTMNGESDDKDVILKLMKFVDSAYNYFHFEES